MIALADLNGMDRTGFVGALGGIFEHSPWIADAAYDARPFASVEALHAEMVAVVRAAPKEQRLQLLRAHPELAAKSERKAPLTAESTSEQASVGLDTLDADEGARLSAANWLYRQRFDFPFIIAVRGQRDRAAIIKALEARTANGEAEEIETALNEVAKIAWFRLSDLVTERE
jgi:2-oxo-4-hydroxy-4-carboxy-5-ureidoimidazoline decarboxylase